MGLNKISKYSELNYITKITSLKNLRDITDIELAFYTKIAPKKETLHETFFHFYTQKLVLLNHFYNPRLSSLMSQ